MDNQSLSTAGFPPLTKQVRQEIWRWWGVRLVLTEGDLTPCPVVNLAGDGDRLLRAVDVGSGVDGEPAVLVLLHACFDAMQHTI